MDLKWSVDGESVDRTCVWDLDLVDSAVKQLAEAFNLPTPLSQQDNEDWRERIKDWRGNAFYKKTLLLALLVMRVEKVDYDTGYLRACALAR